MTPDTAMHMSTEQLRRELDRLRKADEDQRVGDIAVIQRELWRREQHGGDHDIDFQ
jgi:hypothetical protein